MVGVRRSDEAEVAANKCAAAFSARGANPVMAIRSKQAFPYVQPVNFRPALKRRCFGHPNKSATLSRGTAWLQRQTRCRSQVLKQQRSLIGKSALGDNCGLAGERKSALARLDLHRSWGEAQIRSASAQNS